MLPILAKLEIVFSGSALFHMKTRVCLKYLVYDCSNPPGRVTCSGIECYTQNRKVSVSNTTNALGQAKGPNLITRLPVTFGPQFK